MKQTSTKRNTKKRGRPATGMDPVSAVRLPADLVASIDKWSTKNAVPSRSEAIRRLVEKGLSVAQSKSPINKKSAAQASAMAAETLDRLIDKSATAEERATRKQRLLKGPKGFR